MMNEVRRKALESTVHSGSVIYHAPELLNITPPVFLTSNEVNRFLMPARNNAGPCLLGFGTTTNWDLCATGDVKDLILADISPDILLMHMYVYRPLFLGCETPQKFLRAISGEKDLIEEIEVLSKAFDDEAGRMFFRLVLESKPTLKNPRPFTQLGEDFTLEEAFQKLYEPSKIAALSQWPKFLLFPSRFSFLANQKNYDRVREIYWNDRVRFALGDFRDPEMYKAVAGYLKDRGIDRCNVYVSNIPSVINQALESMLPSLDLLNSNEYRVYETLNLTMPYAYLAHRRRP